MRNQHQLTTTVEKFKRLTLQSSMVGDADFTIKCRTACRSRVVTRFLIAQTSTETFNVHLLVHCYFMVQAVVLTSEAVFNVPNYQFVLSGMLVGRIRPCWKQW